MTDPEELYNKYGRKIHNLAYRMTGNREDAKDITQETFISAYRNIAKFKGDSHIYTWLYIIAKNTCLKFLKQKRRSRFSNFKELIEKYSSPLNEDISEENKTIYISQVKDGCLSGLLRCLSLQQRLAFVLHILLNIPVKQVAVVMDNSENATRILIHRAKQNLKGFLCNNCSLFDIANPCRCENLINFSIKQSWISINPHVTPSLVESEIKDLKNVFHLYKTLKEEGPDEDLSIYIKHIIKRKEKFLIFSDKKVK